MDRCFPPYNKSHHGSQLVTFIFDRKIRNKKETAKRFSGNGFFNISFVCKEGVLRVVKAGNEMHRTNRIYKMQSNKFTVGVTNWRITQKDIELEGHSQPQALRNEKIRTANHAGKEKEFKYVEIRRVTERFRWRYFERQENNGRQTVSAAVANRR